MTFAESIQRYRYYLLCLLVLLAGAYYSILQSMAVQWYQDANYSHGFLVPVIAGYFLYERRQSLAVTPIAPWGPGLAVVLLGLFQLIAGCAVNEYFTTRSSLIVLLAGLVLFLFGRSVFRQVLLPLGYLILMVPLPYIVYNAIAFPLKLFVTRVSVVFLKMVGVVVLHEGNILMFPALTLEVADACSGIRSMVSLLALAVACAFYIRTSSFKRCLLVAAAIPVALLTNAARVIVTGLLAQKWGAQVAEGFYHEFAGLMVFVLAMALLAGIGVLLSEPDSAETDDASPPPNPADRADGISTGRFVAAGLLIAAAGFFTLFRADLPVPLKQNLNSFPAAVNQWRMLSQETFDRQTLDVLRPTEYISRSYAAPDGPRVQLYIGYHGGGRDGGEIHSPNHCLPGSGWHKVSSVRSVIDTGAGRINLVKSAYTRGDRTDLFYYWFQVRGRTFSNEYGLKLAELSNSLLHQRRDAAFIRISVPVGADAARSEAAAEQFIKDWHPVINGYLPM
jgi:exosortase D (VPLPA-CTERM-specific)